MKFRTRMITTLAGAGVLAAGLLAAAPATADTAPERPVYATTYKVIEKTYVSNHVDTAHVLARCYSSGGTCTITSGKTATTTINVSLGWSRAGVAGGLGISSASAVTVSVGCTSPKLASGKAWTAYAVGRYFTYKIQKTTTAPTGTTITKSGTLHAFSAYSNQISCR
jgi:hypothetical protein